FIQKSVGCNGSGGSLGARLNDVHQFIFGRAPAHTILEHPNDKDFLELEAFRSNCRIMPGILNCCTGSATEQSNTNKNDCQNMNDARHSFLLGNARLELARIGHPQGLSKPYHSNAKYLVNLT